VPKEPKLTRRLKGRSEGGRAKGNAEEKEMEGRGPPETGGNGKQKTKTGPWGTLEKKDLDEAAECCRVIPGHALRKGSESARAQKGGYDIGRRGWKRIRRRRMYR